MFEALGLIGLLFAFGLVCLVAWVLLLPFYLLLRLAGLALKVGFASIAFVFMAVLLLPVFLLVGVILLLKLLFIGIPLLLAFLLFGWLVGFFHRDPSAPIVIEQARSS